MYRITAFGAVLVYFPLDLINNNFSTNRGSKVTVFEEFREICQRDGAIQDLAFIVDYTFSRSELVEIDDHSSEYTEREDLVMSQLADWM